MPLAEGAHGEIVRGSLDAAVGGEVLVAPVAIVFPVGRVPLAGVGDEVGEGEAVVGGDEVDAGRGTAAALLVEIAGAGEAIGKLAHLPPVALPVAAYGVAVTPVPLRPARRKVAHLVPALPEVPGLGDELHLGDDGVLVDHVEEGGEAIHVVELAGEGGGEIEAEAVHVHVEDPVAQAVHEELERARVSQVEGVAASRVVAVVARVRSLQPIVGPVVDTAEAEGGPELVALGGVVVHHVEDDLDTRLVQALDHGLEFRHLLPAHARRREARVGGEKADGVVAPVVGEPALLQVPLRHGVMDGQQLDGGHPQAPEMVESGRGGEGRVGAA